MPVCGFYKWVVSPVTWPVKRVAHPVISEDQPEVARLTLTVAPATPG